MGTLTSYLQDSTWQAFVFSPLMGVLFSVLLTPPSSGVDIPITVKNTVNSHNRYNSHNIYNYGGPQDDAAGGLAFLAAFGAPIAYIGYALPVLHWLDVTCMFLLTFGLIQAVHAYTTNRFVGRMFVPPVVAALAMQIVAQARIPAAYYQSQSIHLTPSLLGSPAAYYITLQAVGVLALAASLWLATLGLVHLAVMAGWTDRDDGGLRASLARGTRMYGRSLNFVIAAAILLAAELLINGTVYSWLPTQG